MGSVICAGDCNQGRSACTKECIVANHFYDTIRDTIICDAPPDAGVDLPGDGDRLDVGLAIMAVCAAVVVALAGWAVIVISHAWPEMFQ